MYRRPACSELHETKTLKGLGLNANLVRQWRSGRGVKLAGVALNPPVVGNAPKPTEGLAPLLGPSPEFVAIKMPVATKTATRSSPDSAEPTPSPTADSHIHVELRRGPLHLDVRWPLCAAADCMVWLRELSLGLLK